MLEVTQKEINPLEETANRNVFHMLPNPADTDIKSAFQSLS